jgi:hypothetical protein
VHVDLDTLAAALYVKIDDELRRRRSSTGTGRRSGSTPRSPMLN